MLIIGHRGAAGIAQENTLDSLRAGIAAGADMIEFDVRVTADGIPILAHDPRIAGKWIRRTSLHDLQKLSPVATLEEVLDELFGTALLNIEIKRSDDAALVCQTVEPFIRTPNDWDTVIFSSFRPRALRAIRTYSAKANLALLHHVNPFTFVRLHRSLDLTAVGFHRLYANGLALATAKELGLFTYAYTINRPDAAERLERRGIDGIVTDYPNKIRARR